MSIKLKYLLFILLLHSVLVVLIYFLLIENKWYFIASELIIIGSLYASYLLYKALIKPIDLMQSGTDAILDKDFSIKYLKTGSKELDKLVDVFNLMIDNLRMERINTSEQSYFVQNLLEISPLGTIIEDIDGKLNYVNPAAVKFLDLDAQYKGSKLIQHHHPLIEKIEGLTQGVSEIVMVNGLEKYKCQKTEVVHLGFKRNFILIDNLSSEILETEKQAYGKIIRMMAHEVNNSMGAVNSILDTVISLAFQNQEDQELKESLEIAMSRNNDLAKFMENFASLLRLPKPQIKRVNLSALLKKSGQLYVPMAKKRNIEIRFNIPLEISINGDAVLLGQAISNIIKNAIEAISEKGEIYIALTDNRTGFVISDNGIGIPEEASARLFTPFYSTKPAGQGVGLMLVREILTAHHAEFSLSSDTALGKTNFIVSFPS